MRVAIIDVGKPGKNLGWAIDEPNDEGTDLDECIEKLIVSVRKGPVALGFEAPQFVPMRHDPLTLTAARKGEFGPGCRTALNSWTDFTLNFGCRTVLILRYRGAAKDGGTLEYVFEAGERNSHNAITKEKAAVKRCTQSSVIWGPEVQCVSLSPHCL